MSETKPWAPALQIASADYAKWIREAPQDSNFTFWCLNKGKISQNAYLAWAREYYGLASLQEEYFSQSPNSHLWEKLASIAHWSEWMIPVAEWDGVIFIACTEPLPHIEWNFPIQYLLAPASGLQHIWKQLHQSPTSLLSDLPVVSEDIFPELPDELAPPPEPAGLHLKTSIPSEKTAPKENLPESEPPMGIKLDFDLSGLSSEALNNFPLLPQENPETEHNPSGLQLGTENHAVTEVHEIPQESFLQDEIPTGAFPLENLNINESIPDNASNESSNSGKAQDIPHYNLLPNPPVSIDKCQNEDQVVAYAFQQMRAKFERSMALLFEGEKLRPWKWDNDWKPSSSNALAAFDIDTACIFRVVKRTQMPYHGYIINNELNGLFFRHWGYSELPPHVTISPIKYNSHLVGMVLSVGKKEASTPQHLLHHEKTTFLLASSLQKLSHSAA